MPLCPLGIYRDLRRSLVAMRASLPQVQVPPGFKTDCRVAQGDCQTRLCPIKPDRLNGLIKAAIHIPSPAGKCRPGAGRHTRYRCVPPAASTYHHADGRPEKKPAVWNKAASILPAINDAYAGHCAIYYFQRRPCRLRWP
jgi:hypothetical protein